MHMIRAMASFEKLQGQILLKTLRGLGHASLEKI